MIPLVFAPATQWDAQFIAHNLRESDYAELMASGGHPAASVIRAHERSAYAWTAWEGAMPVCIFGVVQLGPALGSPWMVATPALMKHRKQILVEGRRYVRIMRQLYPNLMNFVHADNHSSIAWLKALGFSFEIAIPYGVSRQPFHRFFLHPDV